MVDTTHVVIFSIFAGFIFIHPYLATLGHTPTAHIKAIFTGVEEIEEEPSITGAGETSIAGEGENRAPKESTGGISPDR